MKNFVAILNAFRDEEDGAGITEYACVIAFVGVLIALAFALTRGSLFNALSGSCSSVSGQMNRLADSASSGTQQ